MYVVVGAGLAGCVLAERIATVLKKEVLVIDKREHIGGNIFDYRNEHNILIHKYGPHAFHTNIELVWKYLSKFTGWYPYYHKVKAVVEGIEVPLPFNLNSIYQVFPPRLATKLESKLLYNFEYGARIPILKLKQANDKELCFLAEYVYKKVFLGYTLKQWGVKPEQLDSSVTARVPIYISRDNRYFQDKYQAIPEDGYSDMIRNILDHPHIKVELKKDFRDLKDKIKYQKLIYTGQIDEYFGYRFGKLPFRSLYFALKTYKTKRFQSCSQINYPNNFDFTRITEYKHFLKQSSSVSTVSYEYPRKYDVASQEPYYPIPNSENIKQFHIYRRAADTLDDVLFVGRLAEYKYYNMDQIVFNALKLFEERLLSSTNNSCNINVSSCPLKHTKKIPQKVTAESFDLIKR